MKTMKKTSAYKLIILIGIILFSNTSAAKDIPFSKKFEWIFDVNANATVVLTNYDCDISIETSPTNKVRFELQVDVESKEQEDINILISYLESLSFSSRADMVRLETTFWENRNSSNVLGKNVIKMKLKNGKSIKLSEFKIKAFLYLPASNQLDFTSKYSKIDLTDVHTLKLNSYDDKVYGKNVIQEAEITAKYSRMEFAAFGPTELELYDCNFTAEKTEDLNIESKYSDINVNQTGNIDIDGYDDNMTFYTTGDIKLKTRYSDLSSNTSGNLTFNIYDSDFEISEIGNLTISESKYSGYNFKKAGAVVISSSYDDNFNIVELVSFKALSSKYSDFIISHLDSNFEILEGYDDNVKIYNTSTTFTYLDVNSKYGDILLNTSEGLPLKINWKTKYGKIDFDETKFKTKIKINENSEYEYQGAKGVESDSMPYIKIRGYDIKMSLSD